MTNADLTEMEWLAATLMHTAGRLNRATALLRAAGDLEKLQARLAIIARPDATARASGRPETPPLIAPRARAAESGRGSNSVAASVGASRAVAVFDETMNAGRKIGNNNTGHTRVPF
jgi:hypothetical protein